MEWLVGQGSEGERLEDRRPSGLEKKREDGIYVRGQDTGPPLNCRLMPMRTFVMEVALNDQAVQMS